MCQAAPVLEGSLLCRGLAAIPCGLEQPNSAGSDFINARWRKVVGGVPKVESLSEHGPIDCGMI
jgi:hypothetical protein